MILRSYKKGKENSWKLQSLHGEASENKVNFFSSNPNVATVDDKGIIQCLSSGKTTITAKAEENSVQSQIEIEVHTYVSGVMIDQKELYMQKGDIFKINALVTPDDASDKRIRFESSNEEVAIVNEEGKVTAISPGEANILAISEENSIFSNKCRVFVVREMGEEEIKFDSSLELNSLEISGIKYNENTVLDITSKITTDLEIEVVNNKGEILNDTDIVGTGSKVRVKENGIILREYIILIYGDVNGDGKINSVDLLVLQRHILEIEKLDGIYVKAGNIRKNAPKPTSIDLLLIQRHILGLQIIGG